MENLIDGKAFADKLVLNLKAEVDEFKKQYGVSPGLTVVLVGEDPASQVYVRNKIKRAEETGINSFMHKLPKDTDQPTLNKLIDQLNRDPNTHGILVQLPLPSQLDEETVINSINPEKDVDGFHPINVGRLSAGQSTLTPCTPLGCLLMLQSELVDLSGKDAVIIGRSNIVGKPMAALLLQQSCTVTIVHSRTKDIQSIVKRADIVVAAVGKAEMVTASWIKPGATVIDVGINAIELDGKRKLVGDVCFSEVEPIAGAITPVPGGVGPMTIACLMKNTLSAASQQLGGNKTNG
ncbi:MAG: methylenetetrahydrofolate dehydrogenase (NADP+)/methenyltetrahydrofolate cyclohydrolase [Oceanicoccus sp.]|jgi:methylenetetrahydrofolate dehydrogenase (NADP+)/methenyltetrahydrofolate cyclohydrolase